MVRDMRVPIQDKDEATFAAWLDENIAGGHLLPDPCDHLFLSYTAIYGTVGMVECILARGYDVDTPLDGGDWYGDLHIADGSTMLFYAATHGQEATVRYLLSVGANVNATAEDGSTPLMAALWGNGNRAAIVERLLDAGADINAENSDRETALLQSAKDRDYEAVRLLLRRGADVWGVMAPSWAWPGATRTWRSACERLTRWRSRRFATAHRRRDFTVANGTPRYR